jgi:hypothetical protein
MTGTWPPRLSHNSVTRPCGGVRGVWGRQAPRRCGPVRAGHRCLHGHPLSGPSSSAEPRAPRLPSVFTALREPAAGGRDHLAASRGRGGTRHVNACAAAVVSSVLMDRVRATSKIYVQPPCSAGICLGAVPKDRLARYPTQRRAGPAGSKPRSHFGKHLVKRLRPARVARRPQVIGHVPAGQLAGGGGSPSQCRAELDQYRGCRRGRGGASRQSRRRAPAPAWRSPTAAHCGTRGRRRGPRVAGPGGWPASPEPAPAAGGRGTGND